MEVVFADAGYWIATLYPDDELHQKARLVTEQLGPHRIVTSQMVLVEFLNFMSKLGQHNRLLASNAVRGLQIDPTVEIVPQTGEHFWAAVERYAARLDQRWGVTDCASSLIMESRGIRQALAHDRDFIQAGFAALLRDNYLRDN